MYASCLQTAAQKDTSPCEGENSHLSTTLWQESKFARAESCSADIMAISQQQIIFQKK